MTKYHAVRSASSCGRSFASKGERDCFEMLKLLERAGKIDTIECQVTTPLTGGINHKTDFRYWDLKESEHVWVEYKGFIDQRWRDIKKLWRLFGPGRLKVYGGYGLKMKLMDEIIPEGKECREPKKK
jgi:hypothetical protein